LQKNFNIQRCCCFQDENDIRYCVWSLLVITTICAAATSLLTRIPKMYVCIMILKCSCHSFTEYVVLFFICVILSIIQIIIIFSSSFTFMFIMRPDRTIIRVCFLFFSWINFVKYASYHFVLHRLEGMHF